MCGISIYKESTKCVIVEGYVIISPQFLNLVEMKMFQ